MIGDNCDIKDCRKKAIYEIEESDGNFYHVCKEHINGRPIVQRFNIEYSDILESLSDLDYEELINLRKFLDQEIDLKSRDMIQTDQDEFIRLMVNKGYDFDDVIDFAGEHLQNLLTYKENEKNFKEWIKEQGE